MSIGISSAHPIGIAFNPPMGLTWKKKVTDFMPDRIPCGAFGLIRVYGNYMSEEADPGDFLKYWFAYVEIAEI